MAQQSYGQTPRLRSLLKARAELTRDDGGRLVDLGIEIRVVSQDVRGGAEYLRGKPPLRPLAVHRLGGVWDTVERRFVAESSAPVVWYVGRRQAEFLLDVWANPLSGRRSLLVSAEGGGKTVLMAQGGWIFVLALAKAGIFGSVLATAPTHARLDTFVRAVCDQAIVDSAHDSKAEAFGTFYTASKDLRTVTGHTFLFRATKKASAATGSPIQGHTVLGSLDDELQDSVENGADPDIEARCRGARSSRRICTASVKDSPTWRSFRDSKSVSPDWTIERIRFDENPFVWPDHWERMRRNVSKREWDRRGLALDVGPERMLYTSWERDQNLRPIPQLGAEDITEQILGPSFSMLVGYDPGKLFDVSILLKAYRLRGVARPVWWVVDEVTTENTTTEQHVQALLRVLGDRWHVNEADWRGERNAYGKKALVRADPYSDSSSSDLRPSKSVYAVFRQSGLTILAAAHAAHGAVSKPTPIAKEARIEVVNTLLCNAAGERRLFVGCDDRRQPVAPRLVESLEMSERDEGGKAETARKNTSDLSHWTAGLGYAVWAVERPRMVQPMAGHA